MKVCKAPLLLALLLAACGGSDKSGPADQGTVGDGDDGTNGDGGSGDGDSLTDGDGDDGDDSGDGDSINNPDSGFLIGNGMSELCDGVDNDEDGIIDNLDAEKDGVCDCLNIATIGQIGGWSTGGNVFKEWLDTRSPIGAVELGNQVLTDDLLRPYQVIVVLHVGTTQEAGGSHVLTPHHTFSADEAAALERWVRAGGGLMTTIGLQRRGERGGERQSPPQSAGHGLQHDQEGHRRLRRELGRASHQRERKEDPHRQRRAAGRAAGHHIGSRQQ
jgi:hypothetical protein